MTPEERGQKAFEDWRDGETVGHPAQAFRPDDLPVVIAKHIRDAENDLLEFVASMLARHGTSGNTPEDYASAVRAMKIR